jgi:hypothetical protein
MEGCKPMKKLCVALIVKNTPRAFERERRNMGWWSYPVPQLEWKHYTGFQHKIELSAFRDYDLVFHEDGGNFAEYIKTLDDPPVVYMSFDDTLSTDHFEQRVRQAEQADLVLVDHGPLEWFRWHCKRVRRWPYCVNDRLFLPHEKEIDISYNCGIGLQKGMPGAEKRHAIGEFLQSESEKRGYTLSRGGLDIVEYAEMLGKSRVVVNWPRTSINRPHRVFDSMAAGAALCTGAIPILIEDKLQINKDYVWYKNDMELSERLKWLICESHWVEIAAAGYECVMHNHTWRTRAMQLRRILFDELGI